MFHIKVSIKYNAEYCRYSEEPTEFDHCQNLLWDFAIVRCGRDTIQWNLQKMTMQPVDLIGRGERI